MTPIRRMTFAELSQAARGESGLECPACGCRHFEVSRTMPRDGEIRRVRFCRNCGFRLTTCEVPVGLRTDPVIEPMMPSEHEIETDPREAVELSQPKRKSRRKKDDLR